MHLHDHFTHHIHRATAYNPDTQAAPACVLWPDPERQWESAIPILQGLLPELFVLGEHDPESRTGPAIWLRCVIAGTIAEVEIPANSTPILYLPGVGRQDLRAVESCPPALAPLAELQYRGTFWSQVNGKNWTVLAWLKSDQGGLGLDVAQDADSKSAMVHALPRLLEEEAELLGGRRLDAAFFNALLTGGDPDRDFLQWLDQGEEYRASRSEPEWKAFVDVCRSEFGFNPEADGLLTGAERLARHDGRFGGVWERFCEAPQRYPRIPERIRGCSQPEFDLFSPIEKVSGWPQWNEAQETALRSELSSLADLPAESARKRVLSLEEEHGRRRDLVWAELGHAPLADALAALADMAQHSERGLAGGSTDDLAAAYGEYGWKVDDALLRGLAGAGDAADEQAVIGVLRALYLPWLEEGAQHLQRTVAAGSYPGGTRTEAPPFPAEEGDCVLFVDGLRYDTGRRLAALLGCMKFQVDQIPHWSALPSVTATAKPAVTPVRDKIHGADENPDFEPEVAATGTSLKGGRALKKLLADNGWTVLSRNESGTGEGRAWTEIGDLDSEGHNRGWKLARHVDHLLSEIADRTSSLLSSGWKRVRIVTDHGWLLMPGGLPKVDLPAALSHHKWGRCASIKAGATTDEQLYPWYWNPTHHFALASGVSCYIAGKEYAHGGLSLQECLTLQLVVTPSGELFTGGGARITNIRWRRLRCTVEIEGGAGEFSLDIRRQPGDATSSVTFEPKSFREDQTASVVIEQEELVGESATVVVLDADGRLVAQRPTEIGREDS